jgi:Ig-like domain-containing protein/beta-propeller repeat-containing protein
MGCCTVRTALARPSLVPRLISRAVSCTALAFALTKLTAEAPPLISWATNAGSAFPDSATTLTADTSGNIYVAGAFGGTATFGTNTLIASVGYDLFLAKLDSTGKFLWAKDLEPGAPELFPYQLIRDGAGNLLLMATISGENPGDSLSVLYLAKLDSSGNVLWSKKIQSGFFGGVIGGGITVDAANNIYVTGNFDLTADFGAGASVTSAGGYDVFLVRFNAGGTSATARSFGQSGGINDESRGITIDTLGNIYVAAHFGGSITVGTNSLTSAGSTDIVLVKYNSALNPVWAKKIGNAGEDRARGLIRDAANNLYLLGSVSQQMTLGGSTLYPQIDNTFMVARLDINGNAAWATLVGPGPYGANISTLSESQGLATDTAGSVYVTGDNYFAKLNPAGTIVWSKSATGVGDVNDVALFNNTNYFLCGSYSGTASFDTVTLNPIGNGDIFLTRMISNSVAPPAITVQPLSQTAFLGTNVTFSVVVTGQGPLAYQWFHGATPVPRGTNSSVTLTNISLLDSGTYTVQISNVGGTTTSSVATLTVAIPPPTMTLQPASQTVDVGAHVQFTADATGYPTLVYQWRFKGTNIPQANLKLLALSSVTTNAAGPYAVVVSNQGGSTTSQVATLTVTLPNTPPIITVEPISQSVIEGTNVTFSVSAIGSSPLSYQWKLNGANIPGATSSNLVLLSVTTGDSGVYSVVVNNIADSDTSIGATLNVRRAMPPGPDFTWARAAGGPNADETRSVAIDSAGNLYLTGTFDRTAQFGSITLSNSASGQSPFVAKFDPLGNAIWARRATRSSQSSGHGIAVDADQNVYVTGHFYPIVDFGNGIALTNKNNRVNIFVAKYNSSGVIQWAQGAVAAFSHYLALDQSRNVFIAGELQTGNGQFGSVILTNAGWSDFFLAKFDSNGVLGWVTSGGAGVSTTVYVGGLGIDTNGNALVAGVLASGQITIGTNSITTSSGRAVFGKFDSAGTCLWARQSTGSGGGNPFALALENGTDALIVGHCGGDFRLGSFSITNAPLFLARLDPSGAFTWAGGLKSEPDSVAPGAILPGPSGGFYLAGTYGYDGNLDGYALPTASAGTFVCRLDSMGHVVWLTPVTGSTYPFAVGGLAADAAGDLYFSGVYRSVADFGSVTVTNIATTLGDIFLAKLGISAAVPPLLSASPGTGLVLSWPISAAGAVLEMTPALGQAFAPFSHVEVTNLTTQTISVSVPSTNRAEFFRLRLP